MAHIILIEPNQLLAESTTAVLAEHHKVVCVSSATEAIEQADKKRPDMVILELSLRGHSGFEFLYEFKTYHDWVDVPVIVYTTLHIPQNVRASKTWQRLGIVDYIYKPRQTVHELLASVDRNLATVSI